MIEDPGEGWQLNPGFVPEIAKGKRVLVVLANGQRPAQDWPADGNGGCNWKKRDFDFDIEWFKVR